MIVKLPLQEIVNNIDFFSEFSKKEMNARVAYKFAKILKQIVEEYNSYNAVRQKLIDKYANKDDNGLIIYNSDGGATLSNENYQSFTEELEKLLSTEVELNIIPIELNDIENINFTPGQMAIFEQFIVEE